MPRATAWICACFEEGSDFREKRGMLALALCASLGLSAAVGSARHGASTLVVTRHTPTPTLGLFDAFKKAFDNVDYSQSAAMYEQTSARASHILVKSEEQALELKAKLEANELLFDEAASMYSTCNSARSGGKLGKFTPGQMVKEFDAVVFGVKDTGVEYVPAYELDTVHGPVKTDFGYHLIKITARTMADFDFRAREGVIGTVETGS